MKSFPHLTLKKKKCKISLFSCDLTSWKAEMRNSLVPVTAKHIRTPPPPSRRHFQPHLCQTSCCARQRWGQTWDYETSACVELHLKKIKWGRCGRGGKERSKGKQRKKKTILYTAGKAVGKMWTASEVRSLTAHARLSQMAFPGLAF